MDTCDYSYAPVSISGRYACPLCHHVPVGYPQSAGTGSTLTVTTPSPKKA